VVNAMKKEQNNDIILDIKSNQQKTLTEKNPKEEGKTITPYIILSMALLF